MKNNILLKSALALAIVDLVLIAAILLQVNNLVKDVLELQNKQLEIGVMKEKLKKSEKAEKQETKIEEIDLDVSKWLSYRNEEYNFEIKYPKELETGEQFSYASGYFFKLSNILRFAVLPRGEFDYGLPFVEPQVKTVTISGKEALWREWPLPNNKILIHIYFKEYPESWNKNNRLDMTGPKDIIKLFAEMIENFKFVD